MIEAKTRGSRLASQKPFDSRVMRAVADGDGTGPIVTTENLDAALASLG
jgi:hypothetical protein